MHHFPVAVSVKTSPWILLTLSLIMITHISSVNGIRLKIPLTKDPADTVHATNGNRITRQANDHVTSCTDKTEVGKRTLNLGRGGWLSMLNQRVLFYRSSYATENINMLIETLTVPGLENTTAANILSTLRSEGCPVYIFGGFVRDQFLGDRPNDVDAEVDCEISTVLGICRRSWGEDNCRANSNGTIAHVGTPEILDFMSTNKTLYGPLENLEYTVNSLAYDTNGLDVIIDLPGNGVTDVCGSKIRIPSNDSSGLNEESWNLWKSESKLYRFWKLRVKNFTAYNDATSNYIVTNLKMIININGTRNFAIFYCKLFGFVYSTDTNECISSSRELCIDNEGKESSYRLVLEEDLGADYVRNTLVLPRCNIRGEDNPSTVNGMTDGAVLLFQMSKIFCGVMSFLTLIMNARFFV